MPEHHITEILDNAALAELTEADTRAIHDHVAACPGCAQAFQAAQISALLMKERAVAADESVRQANPFFQTRVLAAWREQQTGAAAWSFRRLWSATGAIVASMAATTAALAVLTFVAPATDTNDQQTAALVPYSAETVVLDQDQDDNQLTNDQVINAIYADDDEGK